MNVKEAMNKVLASRTDIDIVGGVENDTYYLFSTAPKGSKAGSITGHIGVSVNKKTGEIENMSVLDKRIHTPDRRGIDV